MKSPNKGQQIDISVLNVVLTNFLWCSFMILSLSLKLKETPSMLKS